MPCPHKFHQDLLLQNLNFLPTRLVVGTFNPAWPATNNANWFYGRTANNYFWEIVPQLQGQASLINATPAQWKIFCRQQRIAITDLISSITSAQPTNIQHVQWLSNYSDTNITKHFKHFTFVDIVELLRTNPSIERVFLTRGATGLWKKLWTPVRTYCVAKGIQCSTLLTPSGYAYYQSGKHNRTYPNNQMSLPQYIQWRWSQYW